MPFSAILRWHRRWFIPIEIGLLLLITATWWINSRSPMGKLRASGAPVTIADLAGDPIPDDQNAAIVLQQAGESIDSFRTDQNAFYDSDAGKTYAQLGRLAPLPADIDNAIVRLVREHEVLADYLFAIANRTDYAPVINATRLTPESAIEEVNRWRSLERYNTLRQRRLLVSGDTPAAITVAEQTLRLSNHLANEPLMTHRLVSAAIGTIGLEQVERAWRLGELTAKQLDELDQAIAGIENRPSVRQTLESERVAALQRLAEFPLFSAVFYRGEVLDEFEQVIALTELPSHKAATAVRTRPPATSLFPGLVSLLTAEQRLVAHARCMRVAIAMSRTVGPVTAESLGLPTEALLDPFTGQPLAIKSTGPGQVVSAGPDQLLGGNAPTDADDNIVVELRQ